MRQVATRVAPSREWARVGSRRVLLSFGPRNPRLARGLLVLPPELSRLRLPCVYGTSIASRSSRSFFRFRAPMCYLRLLLLAVVICPPPRSCRTSIQRRVLVHAQLYPDAVCRVMSFCLFFGRRVLPKWSHDHLLAYAFASMYVSIMFYRRRTPFPALVYRRSFKFTHCSGVCCVVFILLYLQLTSCVSQFYDQYCL